MIVAGSASPLLLASAAGGYNLTNSLRFRKDANAYLSRTPASAGNRKTFTFSTWLKRGQLSSLSKFLGTIEFAGSTNQQFNLSFGSADTLEVNGYNNGSYDFRLITTQVFRDPSAWYHIVVAIDTTQATNTNRIKLYVNGTQVTSFSTASYPTQNLDTFFNKAQPMGLGAEYGTYNGSPYIFGNYFDGYLTEVNFIDGQALTPSSFGETNSKTGVWQPKKYAGTYGTNGFYLPFTDNSSLTTSSNVGLGKDFSGNGNYWTTNNISITSGATYDSMTDVPTLTSETQANFAVLNPLNSGSSWTLSNANLSGAYSASADGKTISTISATSGKYYFETTVTALGSGSPVYAGVGVCQSNGLPTNPDNLTLWYRNNGEVAKNGTSLQTGLATFGLNDVIGVSIDATAGEVKFYKNNTLIYTASSVGYTDYTPCLVGYSGTGRNWTGAANFGQRPFAYTPPTGFVALNTFNLPTPTIGATASTQANKYFDVSLWTGNGSTQSITNTGGFAPDFVWIKSRSGAYSHQLYDVIRGATNALYSNDTISTGVELNGLTAFNSNGFSVGNAVGVNASGASIVGWQWDAGGTGVTNTAGSITSTVSANTSSGFSIVTYTGNGSAGATVGHGLGVAPAMMIVKSRSTANDWFVYFRALGATQRLLLNSTVAATTSAWLNNTHPSSTVFTLNGSSFPASNASGTTYVAYVFSQVAGFSSFGAYTGNGSTDGTFVYTGFRPKYVMIKGDTVSGWPIFDSARDPSNVANDYLNANWFDAEYNDRSIDILSNGFKIRETSSSTNGNGTSYLYIAFAENPFKYSLAR